MYESLSMLFVSLFCIVQLFNFVFSLLFLSLGDEIKLLTGYELFTMNRQVVPEAESVLDDCLVQSGKIT